MFAVCRRASGQAGLLCPAAPLGLSLCSWLVVHDRNHRGPAEPRRPRPSRGCRGHGAPEDGWETSGKPLVLSSPAYLPFYLY